MELRDQSVGSIDEKQGAVNSVWCWQQKSNRARKVEQEWGGVWKRAERGWLQRREDPGKKLTENSDSRDEKEKLNEQNKDNVQDKETRKENKKREDEKNGAVNENKAKVPAAGNAKGPGKAKRKTVRMDDSFEETDRYATPRG